MKRFGSIIILLLFFAVSTLGNEIILCKVTYSSIPVTVISCCGSKSGCTPNREDQEEKEPAIYAIFILERPFLEGNRDDLCMVFDGNCKCEILRYKLDETLATKRTHAIKSFPDYRAGIEIEYRFKGDDLLANNRPPQMTQSIISTTVLRR